MGQHLEKMRLYNWSPFHYNVSSFKNKKEIKDFLEYCIYFKRNSFGSSFLILEKTRKLLQRKKIKTSLGNDIKLFDQLACISVFIKISRKFKFINPVKSPFIATILFSEQEINEVTEKIDFMLNNDVFCEFGSEFSSILSDTTLVDENNHFLFNVNTDYFYGKSPRKPTHFSRGMNWSQNHLKFNSHSS